MLKESEEEKEEEEEDMIDTFESSLESLFNHFSPSQGNPLALHTYTPPASSLHPESITIRIPPQSHNELFSHYQWQSGIRLANEIAMERIEVKLLHILELGAGTGLPGIMAAKMGAQSVSVFNLHSEPIQNRLSFLLSRSYSRITMMLA